MPWIEADEPVVRRPFDSFEVARCHQWMTTDVSGFIERCDVHDPDEAFDDFWSVYGRREWPENPTEDGYGATCIADFATREQALDMAYALAAGRRVEEVN